LFDSRTLSLRDSYDPDARERARLQAIGDANDWIVMNLTIAKEAYANGDLARAVIHGERAGHTMDEGSSPRHRGFPDYALQEPLSHLFGEKSYPKPGTPEQINLEAGIQYRWDIIRRKDVPIPQQPISSPGGLLQIPQKYLDEARENPTQPLRRPPRVVPDPIPGPF